VAPLRQIVLAQLKPRIDMQPGVLLWGEELSDVWMNSDLPSEELVIEPKLIDEVPSVSNRSPTLVALANNLDARGMQQP
jgi:hypothetical protein